jgi:mannosyltransferase OCH1-like enzyme
MVLMSYTLYFSKSYVKLIVPSTITEINVKNISSVAIPSIIVQTAKNINATGRLSQSFKQLNPNHTYMFFDDKQAEEFVRQHMPPDIIHAYEIMPVPVLKADYFRYIAIYVLGGVYTDIDTECLRPIDKWTDNSTNVSFIVAVEAESPLWKTLYARPLQLCQWTFASMPKHPILKRMIDNVAKQTRKFINSKLGYSSVMDWTGPGVWTDTIFDYINETYHIESRTVSKLQHGRLVGDIYFLPIPAFDPLAYLMGAKGRTDPEARVFHHFHGSWKTFSSTARTRSSVSPNSTGSRPFSKL